ncbi:hypothetical protein F66182_10450 [Fusarium sp. NRRL 66182]|nr:hypothetical protein F66182_10450 [Fusarium sp. NRRL 66182]
MESEKKDLGNTNTQAEPQTATESLPPYNNTRQSHEEEQLQAPEDLPTLVLDGTRIYSTYAPCRILYELSNPPYDASTKVYGIEKMRYRVADAEYEPQLKSRVDHIYDFKDEFTSRGVALTGKTSQKRTYPKLTMSRGIAATSVKVSGLLKADPPLRDRMNQGHNNTVVWKDDAGQTIAVETRLQRDKENKIQELPRLAIKTVLEEKLYDLLVTCWCARVWKEAEKDLKEPLSWEKFKHAVALNTGKTSGIYGRF